MNWYTAQVKKYFEAGMSVQDIAEVLKMDDMAVVRHLAALGLSLERRPESTATQRAEVAGELYRGGYSVTRIGQMLGVDQRTVSRYINGQRGGGVGLVPGIRGRNRKQTDQRIAMAIKLWESGVHPVGIARQVGVSTQTVERYLAGHRHSFKPHSVKVPARRRELEMSELREVTQGGVVRWVKRCCGISPRRKCRCKEGV